MVKELLNNEVNDIKFACLDTHIVYLIICLIEVRIPSCIFLMAFATEFYI